jgi:hypothetical protein
VTTEETTVIETGGRTETKEITSMETAIVIASSDTNGRRWP